MGFLSIMLECFIMVFSETKILSLYSICSMWIVQLPLYFNNSSYKNGAIKEKARNQALSISRQSLLWGMVLLFPNTKRPKLTILTYQTASAMIIPTKKMVISIWMFLQFTLTQWKLRWTMGPFYWQLQLSSTPNLSLTSLAGRQKPEGTWSMSSLRSCSNSGFSILSTNL